jgi:hypothetical protein
VNRVIELIKANRAMMRLVVCVCVLTAGALCVFAMSAKPSGKSVHKTEVLTVFLTGNELGALQPCGCSGGQLGGFDRRWAVLNSVPAQRRLIVDTGGFVEGDSEQDIIKFKVVIQAFNLLGYDLINLTAEDIEITKSLGLLDSIKSIFNIISPHGGADVNVPAKFTKKLSLQDNPVAITVASFDAESASIKQVEELFTAQPDMRTVDILILNRCDANIVTSIAEMGIVDCLVCPAESDEAMAIGNPNKRPLVVSVGCYGKYVGRLQIGAVKAEHKLKLNFLPVPVTEDLRPNSSLVELYKVYQQFVRDENLLEKYPRFPLPNGLKYTGSESCKPCHEDEYEMWSTRAHAHAYATLEKVGSQFDPDCVICHVVGMEYQGGFVSEEKTDHLKNVGCENCHGPGSAHIRSEGKVKTTEPRSACADCHTPEASIEYAQNEERYLEKIIHWAEPNAPVGVKNKRDSEN